MTFWIVLLFCCGIDLHCCLNPSHRLTPILEILDFLEIYIPKVFLDVITSSSLSSSSGLLPNKLEISGARQDLLLKESQQI